MSVEVLQHNQVRAYLLLTACVICGLTTSLVTATKVVHVGINFPFSNLVFSIFTYPIVDCICELWGKQAARQAVYIALGMQLLMALLIQVSIFFPHADFWSLQNEYHTILATSSKVIIASLLAFLVSQILDIFIFQRLKEWSRGKQLWLRSNISTYVGQAVDSLIFVLIVFSGSEHVLSILFGSIFVKIILSLLMTPLVYFIVFTVHHYLKTDTLAFAAGR